MYSVFKPNKIDTEEIIEFIKNSESAILNNETKSTLPTFLYGREKNSHRKLLLKEFQRPLVYKQTKNSVPVYLRAANLNPVLEEVGYLTLGLGLINKYEGSKSFIYDQEFWDCWNNFVKEQDFIGWASIITKDTEAYEAYKRVIEMGLLGKEASLMSVIIDGKKISHLTKVKVTF